MESIFIPKIIILKKKTQTEKQAIQQRNTEEDRIEVQDTKSLYV